MSETKQHTGTKVVLGTPMNRLDYNKYRGWELPADENGDDEGYLIRMFTADKKILTGWLASQTDMLLEDWVEVI